MRDQAVWGTTGAKAWCQHGDYAIFTLQSPDIPRKRQKHKENSPAVNLATAACTTGSEAHKFPFLGGDVGPSFGELSRKGCIPGKT